MALAAVASAVGLRHRAHGTGGEDAVAAARHRRTTIVAVADGHSDPRCVRAARGAELAVAAATGLGLKRPLRSTADRWNVQVDRDIERNPLPPEHAVGRLAYGTTLLACRADGEGIHLLRIGDGEIVTVDQDGTPERPLGSKPSGDPVDSLADTDAAIHAESMLIPHDARTRLVLLATDGVDAAYADDAGLLGAALDLVGRGADAQLRQELDLWVQQAADTSGDDASVAVLWIPGEQRSKAPAC